MAIVNKVIGWRNGRYAEMRQRHSCFLYEDPGLNRTQDHVWSFIGTVLKGIGVKIAIGDA